MKLDQSALVRLLLNRAIEEKEIELAVEEYHKGKITLGEAVSLARKDYWIFISILHDRKIPANLDEKDHAAEIERVQEGNYKKYFPNRG